MSSYNDPAETPKTKKAAVIGTRPTETPTGKAIPADWPMFNAPRPLYGQITFQIYDPGFRTFGWFVGVIDPNDEYSHGRHGFIGENVSLDARELIFVTEQDCIDAAVGALKADPRRYDAAGVDLDTIGQNERYRTWLIDKGRTVLDKEANAS